jgi:hypothetical protein
LHRLTGFSCPASRFLEEVAAVADCAYKPSFLDREKDKAAKTHPYNKQTALQLTANQQQDNHETAILSFCVFGSNQQENNHETAMLFFGVFRFCLFEATTKQSSKQKQQPSNSLEGWQSLCL